MLKKISNGCNYLVQRWLPDRYVFALLLTALLAGCGAANKEKGAQNAPEANAEEGSRKDQTDVSGEDAAKAVPGSSPSSIDRVRSVEILRFMVFLFMFISSFVFLSCFCSEN